MHANLGSGLRDVEGPMANVLASGVFELRDKPGPFLWQFPPSFPFAPERFGRFLARLISGTAPPKPAARDVYSDFDNGIQAHAPYNARR